MRTPLLLFLVLLPQIGLAADAVTVPSAPAAEKKATPPSTAHCEAGYSLKSLGRIGATPNETGVAFSFSKDPVCAGGKRPVSFEISSDKGAFLPLKDALYLSKLQQGPSSDGQQARFALAPGRYVVRARFEGVAEPVATVALTVGDAPGAKN